MPFTAQPQEKCVACGRTVFLTERTIVEEKEEKRTYHKSCIRCTTCDKVLSLGNYASSNGAFYCKPHFKQLFATKGNYDEGFGAEKINSKWDPQAVIAPSSFIPEVKEERKTERKETSEATQEKFKKFREEGESNRCTFCDKTVYLAEKLLVEDKDGKRLFHKACFKCVTCDIILDLRNYGAEKGKIYCKNHLKEVQAANLKSSYVAAPTSFVPEVKEEKKSEKKETSVETQEKFKKFREEGEANKCSFCDKTVYLAEKLLVEDRDGKRLFHKACFKCVTCDIILDLRNYGSDKGKTYCKNHLKEVQSANLKSSYVPPPTSFVPDTQEEKKTEKTATPDHIAAKFKEAPSEKCRACGKSVYLAEKLIVPELKQQHIYHKNCLRCTKCDVKLDLSTYGSDSGRIFCKVHLKEAALPEPAKMKPDDPYNLLPMYNAKKEPSQQSQENQDTSSYYDDDDNTSSVSSTTPAQSSTPVQSSPVQSRSNRNSYRSSGQFTETKPAEPSPQPSPKVQRAAEPEPVRQTEQESEDPEEIRRRERQRAKEERQRKIDEELQREEEERERRKAERERRLASYSDDIDGSSASTSSPSDENEERKKRREQRERERKEQEEREQEERAQKEKEREERRKKREQEAAAEEAERQKKLEEKRRQRNDEQQS